MFQREKVAAVPTCAAARSHCCFVTLVPWSTNQRDCHSADAPNTHVRNQAEIRFRAAQSSTHQLSVAAQEIRLLTTKIVKFIVHMCRNLCRKSRAPKKNKNVRKRSFFIHNSRRSSFIFFLSERGVGNGFVMKPFASTMLLSPCLTFSTLTFATKPRAGVRSDFVITYALLVVVTL